MIHLKISFCLQAQDQDPYHYHRDKKAQLTQIVFVSSQIPQETFLQNQNNGLRTMFENGYELINVGNYNQSIIMSEQLWKYLPHVPQPKKAPGIKRKSQVTDKEVLNLTGGLFPIKLVDTAKNDAAQSMQLDHWVRVPIVQRNEKIGPIYHWVKEGEEKKLYHGEKFNVETDIVSFTEEEFNSIHCPLQGVTFPVAQQLFDLLHTYSLNFTVAHDRFQGADFSIEDLKQMYFWISREILLKRGRNEHPLANYLFDKKYEINRKYELEKYLMRNKVDTDREKTLIAEIRRLEIQIKKEEREQINLKRALKLDEPPEELFELDRLTNQEQMRRNQKVYTRQQYLSKPLALPGKINERLTEVLQGMNIPDKIIATAENVQLFDKLRQKVLLMFSIQRYIRKKENERRILEDKKKKLQSQEDQDRSKSANKFPNERPQKKIHKQ